MTINFGCKFEVKGNSKNYTTIFIKTDWNDADYIATSTDIDKITPTMDAMLWCLENIVDLEDVSESFFDFLEDYIVDFEDSFDSVGFNGEPSKNSYKQVLTDWLFEELDFPFVDITDNPHGHTLKELKVTQFENGSIFEIDYSDHGLIQGKAVATFLVAEVDKWNKEKIERYGKK